MNDVAYVRQLVVDVPDYPKPGIVFKDITPLLADARGFDLALRLIAEPFVGATIDYVAGIEARGFMFATPIARSFGAGFLPVRKPGKLPQETMSEEYALEYGTDALEIHSDLSLAGRNVLIVDDVLATGGTAAACERLINRAGGHVVGAAFLLELPALGGRCLLTTRVHTVIGGDD